MHSNFFALVRVGQPDLGRLGRNAVNGHLLIAPRRRQDLHALQEGSRCHEQLVAGHQRDHDHRRTGDAPAEGVRPRWVDVVLIAQRFVPDQAVDDDEEQEKRRYELPADAPVDAGRETDHVLDVIAEALRSWEWEGFKNVLFMV